MKNIIAQKVVSICTNSKFKPVENSVQPQVIGHTNKSAFTAWEVEQNVFGFSKGDYVICKTKFFPREINSQTIVMTENGLAVNVDFNSIIGVVVAFQREVNQ